MEIPFQLGIITDEVSQRIEEAIALAREFGLTALELRSVDGLPLHQLSQKRLEELRSQIQAAGMHVCALSTPVFKCALDSPEEVAQSRAVLARDLAIAQLFGAKMVRGFSFWAKEGEPFGAALPAIVRQLSGIVPLLEEAGVTFLLEFDPAVYATNAAKVAQLVEAVASPYVKALYDPGNDIWDPDGELPYPDGYLHVKEHLRHIHLKDAVRKGDKIEGAAIGMGQVDYRGLFAKLLEDGYNGYAMVETHYRLRSELTEEQLKRPSGYAFSEGGEEASRQCLEHLFSLLRETLSGRTSAALPDNPDR
ncbi:Xylose isomerase-like TIM barrel [Paenibacillus konkukensis]|uniref:Xylose isomerase-like TIM barrel n=1 Tax=Paenibacillus konkukensis TaxID=2020716 RepID=A0ABY4RX49_9BACL|nr:sugar phosphate isomerase/epimerase family protein [Paenibacillus konkukensis]UQZ86329.1 Xylose isomerase-like TIM barrel [Paenibacillus konkukensis]